MSFEYFGLVISQFMVASGLLTLALIWKKLSGSDDPWGCLLFMVGIFIAGCVGLYYFTS